MLALPISNISNAMRGRGGGAPSYTGPLDLVPGAAVAYSAGRALSAARIGQNVIKLRRDSDDATLDFVAGSNGSVNVAAALAWAAGANLFVDTFYDQSGNGKDLSLPTGPNQADWSPSVVGGHPAATTANDPYSSASFTIASGSLTFFSASKGDNTYGNGSTAAFGMIQFKTFDSANIFLANAAFDHIASGDFANSIDSPDYNIWDGICAFGNHNLKYNGTDVTQTSNDDAVGSPGSILVDVPTLSITAAGNSPGMADMLVYNGVKSDANRLAIRQNMATYYGVTLS